MDGTAPGVVGRSSVVICAANGGCGGFASWFVVFVFPEFSALRSFRTVEFVTVTFMRHGRKQLHC